MTEERDELIQKAFFGVEPRKHLVEVLGEYVKDILTEEERIRRIKEWDEFYVKNPHTGHMSPELYSLPKLKDGYDK
jgi:hypothetical protein